MAINKITAPIQPPASDADWSNTQQLIAALALGVEGPYRVSGSNIVRGAVFNIGGSVYIADADTAITGTPSKYVKITPSGASATASYVASLTGVTWNSTYNGYYDVSGNLYVFDELLAYASGAIVAANGKRNLDFTKHDRILLGSGSTAGEGAVSVGPGSNAGTRSTAVGYTNTASGFSSSAVGDGNNASGDYSFAAGTGQTCDTDFETAINNIRYVRIPSGTTYGTIREKLYILLSGGTSSTTSRETSVCGSYGNERLNKLRINFVTPGRVDLFYGDGSDMLSFYSGSATILSNTIKILFVSGYEA